MKHTELIERSRIAEETLRLSGQTQIPNYINWLCGAIEELQAQIDGGVLLNASLLVDCIKRDESIAELRAEVERLRTELTKAQDELNCTEATLEAASCDLPSAAFDNGFDCMGDFAMAVWQGFKSERDALKLDAERYRWLIDNRSYSYGMQPDSPAEHGIEYQWQQGTYEERNLGIDGTIDAAIAAMKGAA
jgi:uncharacterized small protein (DUF1192 family)